MNITYRNGKVDGFMIGGEECQSFINLLENIIAESECPVGVEYYKDNPFCKNGAIALHLLMRGNNVLGL
jgi:hypothetical protein